MIESSFARFTPRTWTRFRRRAVSLALLGLGSLLSAQPSELDLAYACRIANFGDLDQVFQWAKDPGRVLAGYDYDQSVGLAEAAAGGPSGFQAIALKNVKDRTVIIACRGPEPPADVVADAGMLLALTGPRPNRELALHLSVMLAQYGGDQRLGAFLNTTVPAAVPGAPAGAEPRMVFASTGTAGPSWVSWAYRRLFEELELPFLAADPAGELTRARGRALAFYDQVCRSLREAAKAESPWPWFLKGLIPPKDDPMGEVGGYAVYVTGHSLGGFLAQIVAAARGCHVMTFAAPGALTYLEAHQLVPGSRHGLETITFHRDNDLVGAFGDHQGQTFALGGFTGSPAERQRLVEWARVSQGGIRGYFQANHSLEGIIHQFEARAGRALTEPRPQAAALPEETRTSAATALAAPGPEIRIEAPSRQVTPGMDLIVSAVKASGRNPGWTWTATAGTIVDLGGGNARFTAPSGAAEGTVITIVAEEASSSSSSTPGRGVLEVRTRRD